MNLDFCVNYIDRQGKTWRGHSNELVASIKNGSGGKPQENFRVHTL